MENDLFDRAYWWHNLPLVDQNVLHFHYPLRHRYGSLFSRLSPVILPHVGIRVLELGAGTGWLKKAWQLQDYLGIESNPFTCAFQARLRETAKSNGVTHSRVQDMNLDALLPFDTIICFESFHAITCEALRAAQSQVLCVGGRLVIVDAKSWWRRPIDFQGLGFDLSCVHDIPTEMFDFNKVAQDSLDIVDALESLGITRNEILAAAKGRIQPQLYRGLLLGMPTCRIREHVNRLDIEPRDFGYTAMVFFKQRPTVF